MRGWTLRVCDPSSMPSIDASALALAMAISVSSAKLVAALVQGEDLKSYAAKAGISLSTAKFHLNKAFEKTATHRQSDLVRLASTIAGDLGIML